MAVHPFIHPVKGVEWLEIEGENHVDDEVFQSAGTIAIAKAQRSARGTCGKTMRSRRTAMVTSSGHAFADAEVS
ncbi:unnamed protein product [Cladocopium goreaui]|uniref:Uncharacterized protein n=1 Tax=Cladocopium goreaui TaxID=2562237 RepID=A0A9P1GGW2_9DINO|nr:unnamed protein product [Cladocopium goreaui]